MNNSKTIGNIFPSAGGNIYYYSKDEKLFFSAHPLFFLFDKDNKFLNPLNDKDIDEINKVLIKGNISFSPKKIRKIHTQYLFVKKKLSKTKDAKNNYHYTKLADPSLVTNNFNSAQQIIFEVTDKCNLNCTYCSYGSLYTNYDERYKKDMDFETIKVVLDYYTPFWGKRAKGKYKEKINISFYGGEPLLRLDLIKKTIAYIEKKELPDDFFTYSLTTNGLLLIKSIDFLVKYDFSLLISLDGNKNNHSFRVDHRGNNSFNKVIDNVRFIKNKYPNYFRDKVNFNTVLHSRNNFTDVKNFFEMEGLPHPSISELSKANAKDENQIKEFTYESMNHNEINNINEYIEINNVNASSLSFFRKYCVIHYQNHIDLYNFYKKQTITPTGTCLPFSLRVFVTANRRLLSCEKIGNQFQFGRIDDKDNIVIDAEKALKLFNNYTSTYMKYCRTCYRRSDCKLCAFRNGSLNKDSSCPEYISEENFSQEVQFNISIIEKKPELYNKVLKVLTN
ncbi:MAG: radical SAM peptide maturase [Bacteroidales bacterium]|jgi:uncharacterized protein|nr:radical SAM peptide maturase [Bacteroidales bacterium]